MRRKQHHACPGEGVLIDGPRPGRAIGRPTNSHLSRYDCCFPKRYTLPACLRVCWLRRALEPLHPGDQRARGAIVDVVRCWRRARRCGHGRALRAVVWAPVALRVAMTLAGVDGSIAGRRRCCGGGADADEAAREHGANGDSERGERAAVTRVLDASQLVAPLGPLLRRRL